MARKVDPRRIARMRKSVEGEAKSSRQALQPYWSVLVPVLFMVLFGIGLGLRFAKHTGEVAAEPSQEGPQAATVPPATPGPTTVGADAYPTAPSPATPATATPTGVRTMAHTPTDATAQPTQATAQPTQTTAQPTQTTAQPTQTTAQPTGQGLSSMADADFYRLAARLFWTTAPPDTNHAFVYMMWTTDPRTDDTPARRQVLAAYRITIQEFEAEYRRRMYAGNGQSGAGAVDTKRSADLIMEIDKQKPR